MLPSRHVDDGRLMIDDSKKVNDGPSGLAKLEAGVLAVLSLGRVQLATVREYLSVVAIGASVDDLHAEPWFDADDPLPAANPPDMLAAVVSGLADASVSVGIELGTGPVGCHPGPKFNRLLDEWRLKSGVLATGVIALLNATLELPGDDPIHVTVDKLGGRHFYAPLFNEAFPGGWVPRHPRRSGPM